MMALRFSILICVLFLLGSLVGCGGGGGGGGVWASGTGSTTTTGSGGDTRALVSVLDFDAPETFVNGRVHETTRSIVDIQGGLNSSFTPSLDCNAAGSGNPSGTGLRIHWENTATGQSGETQAHAGCYDTGTIFGVGVRTHWAIDLVRLDLGMNEIRFLTYRNGELVGEDVIRIRRTDGVPPTATYFYPADGASDVPVNRPLIVRFSEPMLESSLIADSLTLTLSGSGAVSGLLRYDAVQQVLTFVPDGELSPDTDYVARLSGRVEDTGGGGPLGDDLAWQFRTGSHRDEELPVVQQRWPDAFGCDCAETTTHAAVGFGEPMDSTSLVAGSVVLESDTTGQVPVDVEFHGDHLKLIPLEPLDPATGYRVSVAAGLRDSAGNVSEEPVTWAFRTGSGAPAGAWEAAAPPPMALEGASGVWTGEAYFLWGAGESDLGRGLLYGPATDSWTIPEHEMDQYDADQRTDVPQPFPDARQGASMVWSGVEAFVFGGMDSAGLKGDGGRYDPLMDSWQDMASGWLDPVSRRVTYFRGLMEHTAVWTGTEMIVWGGAYRDAETVINRGWRYHPGRDDWRIIGSGADVDENYQLLPDEDPLAPEARSDHAAVWTGREMIIWGGRNGDDQPLSEAGRYDPSGNVWLPISTENAAPGGHGSVTAVWTGDRMIAWNGGSGTRNPSGMRTTDLRLYDPVADAWRVSGAGWEPEFLSHPLALNSELLADGLGRTRAVWTGSSLLVVGVTAFQSRYEFERDGWVNAVTLAVHEYDPMQDQWRQGGEVEVVIGLGARVSFTAAWSGQELLVFLGGELLRFTPAG